MRRILCGLAFAAIVIVAPAHADTRLYVGFQTDSRHAPPPPRIVLDVEPRVEVVHEVEVVTDPRCEDDTFRWHGQWYLSRGGYWYHTRAWGSPWLALDVHRVPRAILTLPRERWKHRVWQEERREDRREDRRERRHDR